MCKAHVLRFSCGHGVLMGLDSCRKGPCPVIKTTGARLPQQPYRCYNCQHKLAKTSVSSTRSNSSCDSSMRSFDSGSSLSTSPPSSFSGSPPKISHPLPGVAVQPSGSVKMATRTGSTSSGKTFSFACNGSSHFATPHYFSLPSFMPHQEHSCPTCQLEEMRMDSVQEVTRHATAEYPSLQEEMFVRDGRTWDPETCKKPTLQQYVDEKTTEDREMWVHVTRKWTQDLKKARVLVAEEDGLGLFG